MKKMVSPYLPFVTIFHNSQIFLFLFKTRNCYYECRILITNQDFICLKQHGSITYFPNTFTYRGSRPIVSFENFAKFAVKHQCCSFIFIKVVGWRLATLLKAILCDRVFSRIWGNFLERPFRRESECLRTPVNKEN